MAQRENKARVALKFCGCCNPYLDLSSIARHLRETAEASSTIELVSLSQDTADVVVILCGCPRACGNKPDIRSKAYRTIIIAGEFLDAKPVPQAHISTALTDELVRIFNG